MNIFVLSLDPVEAACMQCDKHVVKMSLETAQILCTAGQGAYLPTHKNHPCTVWARHSSDNFQWLSKHGLSLCEEYTYRYGKRHKTQDVLIHVEPPSMFPAVGLTPFAQAMPEHLRDDNVVAAYRNYYHTKASFARWTRRAPPTWWNPISISERLV